jgi:hypothetical protein
MKLVRFWSRAHLDTQGREDPDGAAIAFGWSDVSPAHARAHAIDRATRIAAVLRTYADGESIDDLRRTFEYAYTDGERPIREPIVERIEHRGVLEAVITRNAYGAYVLNTASVMFVDIDDPPPPRAPGFFARLVGQKPASRANAYEQIRARFEAQPELGARLYRTHSGHRALVTSATFEPTAAATLELLHALGSDPLYTRLCTVQGCFRARLTAKPWRLGMGGPQTHYFPWDDDPGRKARFDAWDRNYETRRHPRAVCRLLGTVGETRTHPAAQRIVDLHDHWCIGTGELA